MTINAKLKGKNGEREAVRLWRAIGFDRAERVPQNEPGHGHPDIRNVPYWIECKRWSPDTAVEANFAKAWLQAKGDMRRAVELGNVPDEKSIMVMVRIDRQKWVCMVDPDIIADIGFPLEMGKVYQFKHKLIDESDVILIVKWDDIKGLIASHYEVNSQGQGVNGSTKTTGDMRVLRGASVGVVEDLQKS